MVLINWIFNILNINSNAKPQKPYFIPLYMILFSCQTSLFIELIFWLITLTHIFRRCIDNHPFSPTRCLKVTPGHVHSLFFASRFGGRRLGSHAVSSLWFTQLHVKSGAALIFFCSPSAATTHGESAIAIYSLSLFFQLHQIRKSCWCCRRAVAARFLLSIMACLILFQSPFVYTCTLESGVCEKSRTPSPSLPPLLSRWQKRWKYYYVWRAVWGLEDLWPCFKKFTPFTLNHKSGNKN